MLLSTQVLYKNNIYYTGCFF